MHTRGTKAIVAMRHIQLVRSGRIRLACMICMEMFGNGAMTGTMRTIIRVVRPLILRDHPVARLVFFAVAPGASIRGAAAPRIAPGTRPATGTSSSDFVLSSWTFNPLLFVLLHFAIPSEARDRDFLIFVDNSC